MNLRDFLPKNLPFNLPFLQRDQETEYFFALIISGGLLSASVWGILGKRLRIINTFNLPVRNDDDLVEASNKVLDEVLRDFQPEPTKILFGVPDSWLQDDNLKDTHLNFLKHLTSELDITPLAYVSVSHAISHFLQKQTGVPTTAILVGVSDPLNVTLVKGGKVLGSRMVRRSNDLPVDIEHALKDFTDVEVLPSKIVLYGSGDLNKFKEEILSFNWMSGLPFLHLPKVDVLEKGVEIGAVSLAGASEIDPDVLFDAGVTSDLPRRGAMTHRIEDLPRYPDEEISSPVPARRNALPIEDFSMPVRRDLRSSNSVPSGTAFRERENVVLGFLAGLLDKPLAFLKVRGINIKLPGGKSGKLVALVVIVLLLMVLGMLFLPKADVKVYVDPKILQKDEQVTADPNATAVDDANKVIPGKSVSTDVEGTQTGNATGTKQVGDSAKGNIIIYNKSDLVKSFSAGTAFVGPNNLEFILDSDVNNVASPSADTGTWGTASGSVTAKQIGPDSNLPAGTSLQIQDQPASEFGAKVDSGLSGGTSKNVTVVTSSDQQKLLASLAASLRNQAQGKLQSQLKGDEKILSEALSENIVSQTYSQKVGAQASSLSLDVTVHYTGTAYSDNDLKSMVAKLVQTTVPAGFTLDLADTQTQADVSKLEDDGKLIFLARFSANLMPVLDTDKIKSEIKGKTPSEAENIIKGMDNVLDANVELHPKLPGPLGIVPLLSGNINIDVTTK